MAPLESARNAKLSNLCNGCENKITSNGVKIRVLPIARVG
jgi:hypothetical protein